MRDSEHNEKIQELDWFQPVYFQDVNAPADSWFKNHSLHSIIAVFWCIKYTKWQQVSYKTEIDITIRAGGFSFFFHKLKIHSNDC